MGNAWGRLWAVAWLAGLTGLFAWGCDDTPTVMADPSPSSGVGAGNPYDGGDNDSGQDAGTGGMPPLDGGESPVWLAMEPNPLWMNGATTPADAVYAELTTYAAGVTAAVLNVGWDELDVDALSARVAEHTSHGLVVVLSLLVVDHTADRRPPAVQGLSWDDPALHALFEADLAAILAAVGDDLQAVIVGRGADTFASAELPAFLDYAMEQLAVSAPAVERAVGLSHVADPDADYQQLAALGSVSAFSYFPGIGLTTPPPETSPAKALDLMIERAGERPVYIQAVGYPTSSELVSDELAQANFLDAFFAALKPRRAAVPLVALYELHDRGAEACDSVTLPQGEASDGLYGEYVCSLGLRNADGSPKEGWYSALQATAYFHP